ncbi:MAG: hypothetical protein J7K40_13805 [candidate division Zixibacteria bacterium]|nr:hypothetical protein [candidate division Zixibacteria bacterium]
MADVELTEIQTSIYEVILEVGSISKKKLANKMGVQLRSISSPVKALIDRGVLVTDEYGDLSIAAGVREEFEDGYVTVPSIPSTPEAPPSQTPSEQDDPVNETDDDNLYNEYWQQHPEELVTFHGEEGLDALKRAALESAMKNAVGVGQKALDAALHWYDIDDDVRRDPTALMRALEDAGVKHNLVGRIARETFLPAKQYGSYIQGDPDPYIHTVQPSPRRRSRVAAQRLDVDEYDDDDYYEDRLSSVRKSRRREDDMPWWAQSLVQRIDAIDGSAYGRGRSEQPQVVIEPVLDEYGHPVPDPNNPGQYLERKVIYEQRGGGVPESEMVSELKEQLAENNAAIAKMREALAEHETDRKISSAMDPLLQKIASLEKGNPTAKTGMTDEQFKLQTEKEIFQDVSTSIENTVSNVIEPVLAGVAEVQKMQSMREIIEMERSDNVAPGTYLKYMTGGDVDVDPITKDRIGNTIDMIKNKTGGR